MLFNLLAPYAHDWNIANLFTYITFRSLLAMLLSLCLSIVFGSNIIAALRKWHSLGQPIREDGPQTHFSKVGTPTMGGLMIIAFSTLSTSLLADLSNMYIWICLLVFLAFGALGFLDDYTKVSKQNYRGITARRKMALQIIVSILACAGIAFYTGGKYSTIVTIPFFKNLLLDLSYFYIFFALTVIIGTSNAVNLTDGLDGLAASVTMISFIAFAIISYLVGNSVASHYLQLIYIPDAGELTVLCAAIIGSCLGFLWYNCYPAEVFMGDTGSISLGGLLGTIAVIVKHEIVLAIIGGVFVIETLSVIIQVLYFKKTGGKRILLMAPIHHHFEKKGWPETKVVIRFIILAIIFSLIGLSSLKLR
jgi:phospho-N-acetylmuramoyl-pentapeptide-transferase